MLAYVDKAAPSDRLEIENIVCEMIIPDRFYDALLPIHRRTIPNMVFNFSKTQEDCVFYDGNMQHRLYIVYQEDLFPYKEPGVYDNINFMIFAKKDFNFN